MKSETNRSWVVTARRRSIIVAALIAIVTLFWVVLLLYTNLPTIALAGVGLVCLVLLSVATAWAAMAGPKRPQDSDSE